MAIASPAVAQPALTAPLPAAPAPDTAPPPRLSDLEIGGITAGAIGVVSLGLGAYFGVQAQSLSDQLSQHDPTTPWPNDIRAIGQRGRSYEERERALLVLGGAAVVTGGVMYVLGRSRRLTERVAIAPLVSRDGVGVTIAGGF